MFRLLLGLLLFTRLAPAYTPPQPHGEVQVERMDWEDAARHRTVPVKIYLPAAQQPCPVIIFSHGAGGSRDGYEFLGAHWAGCGYVSVHLQHAGSDSEKFKGVEPKDRLKVLGEMVKDMDAIRNRPRDVSFAIDQLTRLNAEAASPLHGRLDLARLGVAGHSFGAFTTMAVAGQRFGPYSVAESRLKAAVAMSSPAARPAQRETAYAQMALPVLHLTGTEDDGPGGGSTQAEDRAVPFDNTKGAPAVLITLEGANHGVFAGGFRNPDPRQGSWEKIILDATTAWWDAWLKEDAGAKAWLQAKEGLEAQVGKSGVVEEKWDAR